MNLTELLEKVPWYVEEVQSNRWAHIEIAPNYVVYARSDDINSFLKNSISTGLGLIVDDNTSFNFPVPLQREKWHICSLDRKAIADLIADGHNATLQSDSDTTTS